MKEISDKMFDYLVERAEEKCKNCCMICDNNSKCFFRSFSIANKIGKYKLEKYYVFLKNLKNIDGTLFGGHAAVARMENLTLMVEAASIDEAEEMILREIEERQSSWEVTGSGLAPK